MRLSFDFDGTLDSHTLKHFAKVLQLSGFEVFILTSRNNDVPRENIVVEATAAQICMSHKNIIYVGGKDYNQQFSKAKAIEENMIDIHFDDDHIEVDYINQYFPDRKPAMLVHFNGLFMQAFYNQTANEIDF